MYLKAVVTVVAESRLFLLSPKPNTAPLLPVTRIFLLLPSPSSWLVFCRISVFPLVSASTPVVSLRLLIATCAARRLEEPLAFGSLFQVISTPLMVMLAAQAVAQSICNGSVVAVW